MQMANPESVGFSSERLARIAPAMQRFIDKGQISGLTTLVARKGEIAHFESLGKRDVERGLPMEKDTIFRIYSMSKPITAAAVMMLFEEGKFLLDDPVADYIPEFGSFRVYIGQKANGSPETAPLKEPMTIRNLLTHTSGLPYPNANGSPVERLYDESGLFGRDSSLADFTKELTTLPLVHQPGEGWTYGLSIDVLGYLVEVTSGKSFESFLQDRMFEPLGMRDTGFFVPAESYERLAAIYGQDEPGKLTRRSHPMFEYAKMPAMCSGGGGLVSTTMDYARFCQMLINGGELDGKRLLGPKTIELMTASQTPREGVPIVPKGWSTRQGYGMALGVRSLIDLAASGAPGTLGSFTWSGLLCTDFWADPIEGLFGIVMLQSFEPGVGRPGELLRVLTYSALV